MPYLFQKSTPTLDPDSPKSCQICLSSASLFKGLVDVSDIFHFWFCLGKGKGKSEAPGGGGIGSLLKNSGGGGSKRGRGRGAGKVSAANWGSFGGRAGLNFFFLHGRNVHQEGKSSKKKQI